MAEAWANEWAGALNQRLLLQHWQAARDAAGADVGQWADAGAVWAGVQPVAALAAGAAGDARQSGGRWRIWLRDGAGVGLNSRLGWRGRWLLVLALRRDPATPGRLELLAEERA